MCDKVLRRAVRIILRIGIVPFLIAIYPFFVISMWAFDEECNFLVSIREVWRDFMFILKVLSQ